MAQTGTIAALSGLLAKKGRARPAMRPQGFHGYGAVGSEDDLGWNDMGVDPAPLPPLPDAPKAAPTTVAVTPVRAERIA